jgi:5'-nucleotidase
MYNRRNFIRQASLAAGAVLTAGPVSAMLKTGAPASLDELAAPVKLTILHTNDVHSRLEAFPMDGSRNQGLGGVSARASLINKLRSENEHVLLLDAGDIFQGTPFFNLYKGEPEMKAMSMMGYDAVTMGNHDFDAGLDNFASQLTHATFPVVICNYNFSNTPMEGKSVPYKIFTKGKMRIGVTGVGIELKGLVPDNLYGNTQYLDPVQKLNETATHLKLKEKCDLVICLSHLGYKYDKGNKISDIELAKNSEHVDIIIGGHTHTFLDKPDIVYNKNKSEVIVNQAGWAGIVLGRIDVTFDRQRRKNLVHFESVSIGEKTSQ